MFNLHYWNLYFESIHTNFQWPVSAVIKFYLLHNQIFLFVFGSYIFLAVRQSRNSMHSTFVYHFVLSVIEIHTIYCITLKYSCSENSCFTFGFSRKCREQENRKINESAFLQSFQSKKSHQLFDHIFIHSISNYKLYLLHFLDVDYEFAFGSQNLLLKAWLIVVYARFSTT